MKHRFLIRKTGKQVNSSGGVPASVMNSILNLCKSVALFSTSSVRSLVIPQPYLHKKTKYTYTKCISLTLNTENAERTLTCA